MNIAKILLDVNMCSNYFDFLFLKTFFEFSSKFFSSSTIIQQTATAKKLHQTVSRRKVATNKIEKYTLLYAYASQLFNDEVFNVEKC